MSLFALFIDSVMEFVVVSPDKEAYACFHAGKSVADNPRQTCVLVFVKLMLTSVDSPSPSGFAEALRAVMYTSDAGRTNLLKLRPALLWGVAHTKLLNTCSTDEIQEF